MNALEPVQFRQDWAPAYLSARPGALNRDMAYTLADAEGMPGGPGGARVHGGWDVFAPAGTPVVAPYACTIVRADESSDHDGGVFGGVLALRRDGGTDGMVFRHVDPARATGAFVPAGEVVAFVFDWHSGGDHLHLECHRIVGDGRTYHFSNTVDPRTLTWIPAGSATATSLVPEPEPAFCFESPPARLGGIGPDIYGPWLSAERRDAAEAALDATHDGRATRVRLRGPSPNLAVVVWPEGEHGTIPRWSFPSAEEREAGLREARTRHPGVHFRTFRGLGNSMYARLP